MALAGTSTKKFSLRSRFISLILFDVFFYFVFCRSGKFGALPHRQRGGRALRFCCSLESAGIKEKMQIVLNESCSWLTKHSMHVSSF